MEKSIKKNESINQLRFFRTSKSTLLKSTVLLPVNLDKKLLFINNSKYYNYYHHLNTDQSKITYMINFM